MKKPHSNRDRNSSRGKGGSGSGRLHDKKPHGQKSNHKPHHKQERGGEHSSAPQRVRLPKADLYGTHAVREAWMNPEREISALYISDQAVDGFRSAIEEATRNGLRRPPMNIVDKGAIDGACPDGAVHQGIAIVCSALPEVDVTEIIIRGEKSPKSIVLILDQVTDPHNVGAILRSACAFGASGIIMQRKHAPELYGPAAGLLAKTACGALEHVPVAYETNLSRTIETLQEAGYFVYGLDERGENNIGEVKIADKAVLVMGAEGPGIRHLIKEHCDMLVKLPMDGAMPSINVSNAAAVALYALRCQ